MAPLSRRAFQLARWLGLSVMLCAAAMIPMFPTEKQTGPLAPGFHSPIIAFELAASRDEVETMFKQAGSPEREELRQAMDRGNQVDFVFLVLYAGLLGTVALGLARRAALWLAPLAAAADVLENLQLFAITRALGADYTAALAQLQIWTRIKWGALALALIFIAPALLRRGRFERAAAMWCGLTGLLGLAAAFDRTRFMELFSLCVSIAFIALWVVSLRARRTG
ncbi:MAG TPA: hypothetical protein VFN67_30980 [Polyangiales bacterium]|nr:hypothetical protein [Polyangiales bacterium]